MLVGVKEDSQKKLRRGVTYAYKSERTLKENGVTKPKMYKKSQKTWSFSLALKWDPQNLRAILAGLATTRIKRNRQHEAEET